MWDIVQTAFRVCIICKFPTELDDVIFRGPDRWCVCLRCYQRTVEDERHLTKTLDRGVQEALAAAAG